VRRIALTAVPSKQGVEIEPGASIRYAPTISPDGPLAGPNVSTESDASRSTCGPFPRTWRGALAGVHRWGVSPVWGHSGRELFFADAAGRLVSVAIVGCQLPGRRARPCSFRSLGGALAVHQGFDVCPRRQDFYFLEDPSAADASGRFATLTLNALAGLDARPDGR
jgi:hypothetical protein